MPTGKIAAALAAIVVFLSAHVAEVDADPTPGN
jgi:hypothetical protein